MTTYTIYANTNDHAVQSSSASYSTARSGSSLTDNPNGTNYLNLGQILDSGTYYVYQLFLSFDTSAVRVGTPTSVSLNMEISVIYASSTTIDVDIVNWAAGTASFVAGASLSGQSQFGSAVVNSTGYKSISSSIDPTRTSAFKLMAYDHKQETNTAPTGHEDMLIRAADWTGTASDPYLVIVMPPLSVVASAGAFTLTGMAAGLSRGRSLIASAGAFILTGIAAAMGVKRYPPPERTITFSRNTLEDRTLEL